MNSSKLINECISPESIHEQVKLIARQISHDYNGRTIDLVCLTGGGLFLAVDLARIINLEINFHIMSFSAYSKNTTGGQIKIIQDIDESLEGRNILVVEGVIISGKTPKYVMDLLRLRNPASLEMCALGVKRKSLQVNIPIRYTLFEFDDEWIEGYGIGSGSIKVYPGLIDRNAK